MIKINCLMKNKLLTIFIILSISFYGNSLLAINNSIGYYYIFNNQCDYHFRDTSNSLPYTPNSYFWDFGDGNTSTDKYTTHNYLINGNYQVKYIVTDGSNRDTAIWSLVVNCRSNKPLKADFSYKLPPDTLQVKQVNFTNESDGKPTSFYWDFGDGNTSTLENPSNIYSTSKAYYVKLKIFDGVKYDSIVKQIFISGYDSCLVFKSNFLFSRSDTNCKNIEFNNLSHYTAISHLWDFGDGNFTSVKNPSHIYSLQGTYNVKLVVISNTCKDSITQQVKVKCRSCYTVEAIIVLQVDSANPSKAKLYNYSSGAIDQHFWDFGDGSTSNISEPTHVYTTPGSINLRYVARDTNNCYDTTNLSFVIDSLGRIKRGNINFTLEIIDKTNTILKTKDIEKENNNIVFYPNPCSDYFQVKNGSQELLILNVMDVHGKYIGQLYVLPNTELVIDTKQWNKGMYLIQTNTNVIYKLIVN